MGVRVAFVLKCPLILFLLKHRSPLNSSIDVLVGVRVTFLPKCPLVLSLLKHRGVVAFLN